jgi:hypothetical protein
MRDEYARDLCGEAGKVVDGYSGDQGRMAGMLFHARILLKRWIKTLSRLWVLALPGLLALSACQAGVGRTPTSQVTVPATAVSNPTATSTAEAQRVLLVIPEGTDDLTSTTIRTTVDQLTTSEGFTLEEQVSLPAQIGDGYVIAIMLYPDQAFLDAAHAHTGITFVAIAAVDFPAGANLWVIGNRGGEMDAAAFLAGYIAAMITPEWRIGAISVSGNQSGDKLGQAFVNGGTFFCGLCRPQHPPYYSYPALLPMNSLNESAAQAVVSTAEDMGLASIWAPYEVLQVLSALDLPARMSLLGEVRPGNISQDAWIASIRPAPEQRLAELWGLIQSGAPTEQVAISIVIEDVNPSVLTPGKLELAQQVRDELVAGFIDPGASGE